MSWYNTNWTHRFALSVNNVAGSAGAITGTIDLSTMPDEFWDNVKQTANGYDIVATGSDGKTKLVYDYTPPTGISVANRTGTLRFQYAAPAEGMLLVWVYCGYASAADGTGAVTIGTPKTVTYEAAAPRGRMLTAGPERPGSTNPAQEIAKTTSDQVFLFWDVTDLLEQRTSTYNSSLLYEEPDYAQFGVEAAGSEESGLFDEAYTRFLVHNERLYVRTLIKAGTDTNRRTARLRLGTTLGQIIDCRAFLKIDNADET